MSGLGQQIRAQGWEGWSPARGSCTSGTSPSLSWYNCVAVVRRRHPLSTGKHTQEEERAHLPPEEPGSLQQLQAPAFLLHRLTSLYSHSPCSTNCLLRHSMPDLSSQPLGNTGFADYYTLVHIRNVFFPLFSSEYFSNG